MKKGRHERLMEFPGVRRRISFVANYHGSSGSIRILPVATSYHSFM